MLRRTFPDSAAIRAVAALLVFLLAAPTFAGGQTGTTAKSLENAGTGGQALRSLSNEAMNRLLMNIPPPRISPQYAGGL